MRLISGNLNPFQFIVNEDGVARRANFWDGVIPLILELKKSLGLNSLRVVVDAYFSKVPFLSPLVQMQQVEPDWMPKVSASCSAFSFSRLRRGLQHFA